MGLGWLNEKFFVLLMRAVAGFITINIVLAWGYA